MKFLLALLVLAAARLAAAEPSPEPVPWLRYPAVSPDGTTIAFAAGGRIWRVPATGGDAVPLTDGDTYSVQPVWAPDGSRLAFAGKRHGNLDIFLVPAAGGRPTRLTYHSADDRPSAFSPDGTSFISRPRVSATRRRSSPAPTPKATSSTPCR